MGEKFIPIPGAPEFSGGGDNAKRDPKPYVPLIKELPPYQLKKERPPTRPEQKDKKI